MNETYLIHHGIKGQKWGIRRFQNEDGTRTEAGLKRYGNRNSEESRSFREQAGSGVLLKRNKTQEAINYQNADDDSKRQAFKESKAAFKANKTNGQRVANVLVNGPVGAELYNNLRAQGNSVGVSLGVTAASRMLLPPIGVIAATVVTGKGYGASDAVKTSKNVAANAEKMAERTKETAKKRIFG